MRPACLLVLLAALDWTAHAKLNVVATTSDLGAIAREIGGDRVTVTTLAKPTEDPHFVDAKPSFIVKLNGADALVEGGAELESAWLAPLLAGARNAKLAPGSPGRIICSKGITMLEVPATLDRSQGDLHAAGNPHYSNDPLNGKIIAETVTEGFCQLDPKSAEVFRSNLRRFSDRLQNKLAEWQKLLAPFQGRRVVTYHNYWPYFANRFGLTMDVFLEPKPGIPPSPAHLTHLVGRMKAAGVHVILVQSYVSRKSAETVAGLTGAVIVDVPAFPGGAKDAEGYLEWMDWVVRALARGLAGQK